MMDTSIYEKIYVVGSGAIPLQCAQLLNDLHQKYVFLEIVKSRSSFAQLRSRALGVEYGVFNKNIFIDSVLFCSHPTLILSVNNSFLFPQKVVESKHIRIVNYHNSLLPFHRGVNAEAWSLFDHDVQTGITWHFVDCGIDTGDVITQSNIILNDNITSLRLLRDQGRLAIESLKSFLPALLSGKLSGKKQIGEVSCPHLRRDVPNNGELSIDWDVEKAWCFLRAMDYGPLKTLGIPYIYYKGLMYGWRSYTRLKECDEDRCVIEIGNNLLYHGCIILNDVFKIFHDSIR